MSARIPPGFAELWFQINTPGDVENMYFALGIDVESGSTVDQTVVNTWMALIDNEIDDNLSSAYQSGPGHVIVGQDGGDLRVDGSNAAAAFLGAATGLPVNCAYLIRKITATGGRRGRGRIYCPGCVEADVGSDGDLSGGALTAIQGDWTAVFTNLNANADIAGLVLFHDTAPFTPTPITSFNVQGQIATQRRRLRP